MEGYAFARDIASGSSGIGESDKKGCVKCKLPEPVVIGTRSMSKQPHDRSKNRSEAIEDAIDRWIPAIKKRVRLRPFEIEDIIEPERHLISHNEDDKHYDPSDTESEVEPRGNF
jgi:hypothetical protein